MVRLPIRLRLDELVACAQQILKNGTIIWVSTVWWNLAQLPILCMCTCCIYYIQYITYVGMYCFKQASLII